MEGCLYTDPTIPCIEEENNIFTMINACRVILYTPIIFLGGLLGSIAYDYITFKEDKETKSE
jgi:hypothetical protein